MQHPGAGGNCNKFGASWLQMGARPAGSDPVLEVREEGQTDTFIMRGEANCLNLQMTRSCNSLQKLFNPINNFTNSGYRVSPLNSHVFTMGRLKWDLKKEEESHLFKR